MIRSMEEFSSVSASDLNLGYYHIKLDHDPDAQIHLRLYSYGTWKNKKYKTFSHRYQDCLDPDIFQNVMCNLVQDMEYAKTTILC
jgi:hypothetical protein